jgi:hypothetical protein
MEDLNNGVKRVGSRTSWMYPSKPLEPEISLFTPSISDKFVNITYSPTKDALHGRFASSTKATKDGHYDL